MRSVFFWRARAREEPGGRCMACLNGVGAGRGYFCAACWAAVPRGLRADVFEAVAAAREAVRGEGSHLAPLGKGGAENHDRGGIRR